MHPRTEKRLRQNGLYTRIKEMKNLLVLPPLGYLDFLVLMKHCEIVITDSGGIQEEATAPNIRKPVLVIRLSTERPEAVEAGFAQVVGVRKEEMLKALETTLEHPKKLPASSPYGDGNAAERILSIIAKDFA